MTERLINDELNKILSGNYDNETIVFLLGGEKDDRVLNRLLLLLRQQVLDKDAKIQRLVECCDKILADPVVKEECPFHLSTAYRKAKADTKE
jgi:hypothetical protein